jgi:hypothetical protein
MKSILFTIMTGIMCVVATTINAQIITRHITPDSLSAIIPGYVEVSKANRHPTAFDNAYN